LVKNVWFAVKIPETVLFRARRRGYFVAFGLSGSSNPVRSPLDSRQTAQPPKKSRKIESTGHSACTSNGHFEWYSLDDGLRRQRRICTMDALAAPWQTAG